MRKLVKLLIGPLSDGLEKRPLFADAGGGAPAFHSGLFTVKIRRGLSPGVPRLHVSKLSTHEGVKGSAGPLRKPERSDSKLQMSSGMKRAALQVSARARVCKTVHHSDAVTETQTECVPLRFLMSPAVTWSRKASAGSLPVLWPDGHRWQQWMAQSNAVM